MSAPSVGIVLLQLGTPDAPETSALRRYLHEFLNDRRVIDLPRALWWPILYGMVLPTRPKRSAELYRRIWTPEGSPLAVITQGQVRGLEERLQRASPGAAVRVTYAMRYGQPPVSRAIDELIAAGCDRLVAVPMYPQYASATTGSSVQQFFEEAGRRRVVPPVRVVPPYFLAREYIQALAATVRDALGDWPADHVLMSFHGLPKRYATLGDPYPQQCLATASALSAVMGWPQDRVTVSFQSRFGREEWLQPYTEQTLRDLAHRRLERLAVLCPGFTADCLETLEEMDLTNGKIYRLEGGGEYRRVPCLNTHDAWLDALAAIVGRELQGWIEPSRSSADLGLTA
ncbi:MAG: ferrochelatase [Acidobacteria bacterium]|nr:ferrochelatase [Acidobacteriota bacterium]